MMLKRTRFSVGKARAMWPLLGAWLLLGATAALQAQLPDPWDGPDDLSPPSVAAEASDQDAPSARATAAERDAVPTVSLDSGTGSLQLLELLRKGGPLMIPVYLMSILVVTLSFDRFFGLRRERVLPQGLLDGLNRLALVPAGFDPRKAYRLAQQYPSATAAVVRSMLLKVGRPQSELERVVAEASEREAARLYSHVRWLNLAAAVTPLFGLFGTVWGMIRAFFDYSQLQIGQNKADFLAEGIYVALVTTFGGLAVAIPAAILAHYFEGRIQTIMFQVDELLFNLLPQVERFEGRLRVTRQSLTSADETEDAVAISGDPEARINSPELDSCDGLAN